VPECAREAPAFQDATGWRSIHLQGRRGGGAVGVGGMSPSDQLLAVSAWLRGRYESAPAVELPLLASVIAYLEALAAQEAEDAGRTALDAAAAEPADPEALGDDAPDPRRQFGTFRETGAGGVVSTAGGTELQVPYSVVSASGMRHGDRVAMTPKDGRAGHFFFVPCGPSLDPPASPVRELVGLVQQREHGLAAEIEGRMVAVRRALPYLPRLAAGDVVTLRYVSEELRQPAGCAYVVRVHADRSAAPPPLGQRRRVVPRRAGLGLPKPAPVPQEPRGAVGQAPGPETGLLPEILVIGGHDRNRLRYREALAGVARVDWSAGTRLTKSLRGRLETARAVVLVTQHMSHPVSDYVVGVLRATNKPHIYARSGNQSGLARQVVQELLPQIGRTGAETG